MSYTKPTGIPCEAAETVVQLDDSAAYVAVQCITQRDPLSNTPIFAASARYIDATGAQQHDAAGRSIITTITHAASADQVAALTASVIVRECLYLVLGEALTPDPDHPETNMLMFSADNIAQCSIRNAIAAAAVNAPDAGEVL
jgi:hypothetical protein